MVELTRCLLNKGDQVKRGRFSAKQNTDLLDSQLRKLQAERLAALAALDEMKAGPRRENIDAAKAKVSEVDAQLRAAQRVLEKTPTPLEYDAISREDFEQSQSLVEQLTAAKSTRQKTLEDSNLELVKKDPHPRGDTRIAERVHFFGQSGIGSQHLGGTLQTESSPNDLSMKAMFHRQVSTSLVSVRPGARGPLWNSPRKPLRNSPSARNSK